MPRGRGQQVGRAASPILHPLDATIGGVVLLGTANGV
jgi:hypothetical protein